VGSTRNERSFPMVWPAIDVCLAVAIITLATGAMQLFRQEEPKTQDSAPLEASVRQAKARMEALQAQYEELLREREKLPDEVPEAELEKLQAARLRLLEELAKLREEQARLRAALKAAEREESRVDEECGRVRDALDRLQREIEKLEARIKELEAQLKKLRFDREQIEKLEKELEALKRKLEEVRKQYVDLQEQIGKAKAERNKPAVVIDVPPRLVAPGDLKREIVIITQATVTPVDEPYYEPVFTEASGVRIQTGLRFVRRGEALNDALRRGSDFLRWLDTIDRRRQYVLILVGPASFDSFRAVREELRKRKIKCGWDPNKKGNADVTFVPKGVKGTIDDGDGIQ